VTPTTATDREGRRVFVRPARADDQSYVARTWVASVLDGDRVHHRPGDVPQLNRQVDHLLDDPLTRILIACPGEDQTRILGFVAYAGRTLLYVCVRSADRKNGIGRALMREAGLGVNGKPILYVYDGPAARWARDKRPDAVKTTLEEHLS
jgi:ribosomal protein S18 acetylase RimI-like enzyme